MAYQNLWKQTCYNGILQVKLSAQSLPKWMVSPLSYLPEKHGRQFKSFQLHPENAQIFADESLVETVFWTRFLVLYKLEHPPELCTYHFLGKGNSFQPARSASEDERHRENMGISPSNSSRDNFCGCPFQLVRCDLCNQFPTLTANQVFWPQKNITV